MASLLHLPQNVWRDNVLAFFSRVEHLVRLDSAVVNTSDRTVFLSNIDGCKMFYCFFDDRSGKSVWFCARNIIIEHAVFTRKLHAEDTTHFQQLLSQAKSVNFYKNSLSKVQPREEWFSSDTLTELYIWSSSIEDLRFLSVCKNLVDLSLEECDNASQDSMIAGLKGCTRLKTCSLVNCTHFSAAVVVVLLQSCLYLSELELRGTFDLSEVFSKVTTATSITSLTCTNQQSVLSGRILRAITTVMPQVATLRLQFPSNTITDADVVGLVHNHPCMNIISLNNWIYTTNAALVTIAQSWPTLQSVFIDYCYNFTDEGIISLAHLVTNLRTLRLTSLNVTDAALHAVGTYCRLLENLDVTNCTSLTDNAFTTLNMSRLTRFDVSGTRVTGNFATHVFSSSSVLSSLTCNKCLLLQSEFVSSLSRYSGLRKLALGDVRLSESDWLQLSSMFPNLRILNLSSVPVVNDKIARSFKINCPELLVVTMHLCSVSEDLVKQLWY